MNKKLCYFGIIFIFFSLIVIPVNADDIRIDRIEIKRTGNISTSDQFYYSKGILTKISIRSNYDTMEFNESKMFIYKNDKIENICFSKNNQFLVVYNIIENIDSISYKESETKNDGTYFMKENTVGKNALLPISMEYKKYETEYPDFKKTCYFSFEDKKYIDWLEIFPNCIKKKISDDLCEYYLFNELYGKATFENNQYNIYLYINNNYQLLYSIKIITENGISNYVFRVIY